MVWLLREGEEKMTSSNSMNSGWLQRIAIIAIAGVLLVTAAIWASGLSADTGQSSLLATIPVPIPYDRVPPPNLRPTDTRSPTLLAVVPVPIPYDRVPRPGIRAGADKLV